jgi:hypothetical protein
VVIPFLFVEAGPGAALLVMCLMGLAADFTMHLIRDLVLGSSFSSSVLSSSGMAFSSYYEMVHRALGRWGYFTANACSIVFNFAGYLGSLLILGGALPDLLHGIGLSPGWVPALGPFAAKCLAVFICAPFAYFESIGRFAPLSLASCGALIFVIGTVIGRFIASVGSSSADLSASAAAASADAAGAAAAAAVSIAEPFVFFRSWRGVLLLVGGFGYQFTCHDVFPHCIHSLKDPTPRRVGIVSNFVTIAFAALAGAVGIW